SSGCIPDILMLLSGLAVSATAFVGTLLLQYVERGGVAETNAMLGDKDTAMPLHHRLPSRWWR
ncbi:hypothetical protein, partial [Stenotrophomonas maltophilia]|uniref:hypothetical protein n=1 Tax=Stenotrophomonas maltophilia TaxID=40324 RepID=UPI001A8DCB2B